MVYAEDVSILSKIEDKDHQLHFQETQKKK